MHTIQELRAFHKMSKPGLKKALENIDKAQKSEVMSVKSKFVIQFLSEACESYDQVIDQLFEEIDRLNGMKV